MRVVVAPDSFKGSSSAARAAEAIADGWSSVRPGDELVLLPQADGGEGTLEAIGAAVPGAQPHEAEVTGPDGRPVVARWLQLPDGTAVAELAQSSGLPLMRAPDAEGASTAGLGEVLGAALDAGATALVIGLGGSASTDGGAGALQALGLRLTDAAGVELVPGGAALAGLASVDRAGLRPPPVRGVRLLTDVTHPLLGARGAAATFAPQKGADPAAVERLEHALATWARQAGGDPAEPGAGAAGGTAFGLAALWGARIVPGSAEIARLSGLDAAVASADLLISGEGRFDATSLDGKVVGNALELAAAAGVRTLVIAGQVAHRPPGAEAIELAALAGSAEAALAYPPRWLREAGARAATASP